MTESHRRVTEIKEQPTTRREVVVHFFRHGEQVDHSPGSGITEKATQSAFQAGKDLIEKIGPGELVKFVSSQRERAKETLDRIQEGFEEAIEESGKEDIKLYTGGWKIRNDIRMFDIEFGTDWFKKFASSEDPMGYWLDNPSEQTESPEAVLERFQHFVSQMTKVANRIPAGPKIHYVVVTHSGPMRAFLRSEFGPKTGDDLEYCEAFNIAILSQRKKLPVINFRNKSKEVSSGQKQG